MCSHIHDSRLDAGPKNQLKLVDETIHWISKSDNLLDVQKRHLRQWQAYGKHDTAEAARWQDTDIFFHCLIPTLQNDM